MSEIGVIDTIARALVADLPAGWREVSAVYRSTTSYAELDADVLGPSGTTQLRKLPAGLEDRFEELRRAMYQPGKGTWLTARLTVTSTGTSTRPIWPSSRGTRSTRPTGSSKSVAARLGGW